MTLTDTYKAIAPAVVGFVSRIVRGQRGVAPVAPPIVGTGFLVREDGIVVTNRHVVEILDAIPRNPETGERGCAAMIADPTQRDTDGELSFRMMLVEILDYYVFSGAATSAGWFGEQSPDIGFVQLQVRGLPFLKFASRDYYIQPGTQIATAGFPLGSLPLTAMGKWSQFIPFVRIGIVSSVLPAVIPQPHGLTIDIMQQGGSSGSPIFYVDDPTVVGMMTASVIETVAATGPQMQIQIGVNTNISFAIPAHIIENMLRAFVAGPLQQIDRSSLITVDQWRQRAGEPSDGVSWTEFGPA